jgi:Predicted enzyme related to lactoylglutathione lyase
MLKKLRTVIIHTPELKAAKDWYTKVTGQKPHFDESYYVGFDIDGCELGIDPDMTNIEAGNQTVAYWAVDNVVAASTHFISNGATLVSPVTSVGENIKVAVVSDPFGNHIGLIEGA